MLQKLISKIKRKVNIFLDYIKEVLSQGDDETSKYIIKWISNVCQGKKNDSCLYFKSIQGDGKQTLSVILCNRVLGKELAIISSSETLTTRFNEILNGKLLVVFEELPTFTKCQWDYIDSKLKDMITGNSQMYENKNTKAYSSENINNYIINTNVDQIKSSNGRRYFIVPVSGKHNKDTEYFENIYSNCDNDEVGEAIYNYFLSIDTSNFRAQRDMPENTLKLDAIAEHLPLEYKFLKFEYILTNKDLKGRASTIHSDYEVYCAQNDKKPMSLIQFNRKLGEVNIHTKISHGNTCYNISNKELKEIGNKRYWFHELDGEMKQEQECKKDFSKKVDYEYLDVQNLEEDKKSFLIKNIIENKELFKQIEKLFYEKNKPKKKKEQPAITEKINEEHSISSNVCLVEPSKTIQVKDEEEKKPNIFYNLDCLLEDQKKAEKEKDNKINIPQREMEIEPISESEKEVILKVVFD